MKRFFYSIMSGQRNDGVAWAVRVPLFILSLLYGLGVRLILMSYRAGILPRKKLDVPVISVGNITMGGVGKTPMVVWLTGILKARKLKPAILTRGYKVRSSTGTTARLSDEVQFLKEELPEVPVIVNPDRYAGGVQAIKEYAPDVLILDDGFQHWRLARDLEIVLSDSSNPFGNGQLLPCGILREPVSSLGRADVLVLTKTDRGDVQDLKKRLTLFCPRALQVESVHRPKSLVEVFTGDILDLTQIKQTIVAFCGIGDPLSFKKMLVDLGADVKEFVPFMDHHAYDGSDVDKLKRLCHHLGVRTLVTTRKDAVKLKGYKEFWQGYQVLALNIQLEITSAEEQFIDRIDRLLHR